MISTEIKQVEKELSKKEKLLKAGYKRFCMTVKITEWLPYPYQGPEYEIIKHNFPAWLASDWLNEGIAQELIEDTLEYVKHNTGLFRISGYWTIKSYSNSYWDTDNDAEFDSENVKALRICKRKK